MKTIPQQLDDLRRTNPDFQSIMSRADKVGMPRERVMEVALVFFINKSEAYQDTIANLHARIGGDFPITAYPAPEI
jgi:hypothetical protein